MPPPYRPGVYLPPINTNVQHFSHLAQTPVPNPPPRQGKAAQSSNWRATANPLAPGPSGPIATPPIQAKPSAEWVYGGINLTATEQNNFEYLKLIGRNPKLPRNRAFLPCPKPTQYRSPSPWNASARAAGPSYAPSYPAGPSKAPAYHAGSSKDAGPSHGPSAPHGPSHGPSVSSGPSHSEGSETLVGSGSSSSDIIFTPDGSEAPQPSEQSPSDDTPVGSPSCEPPQAAIANPTWHHTPVYTSVPRSPRRHYQVDKNNCGTVIAPRRVYDTDLYTYVRTENLLHHSQVPQILLAVRAVMDLFAGLGYVHGHIHFDNIYLTLKERKSRSRFIQLGIIATPPGSPQYDIEEVVLGCSKVWSRDGREMTGLAEQWGSISLDEHMYRALESWLKRDMQDLFVVGA